MDENQRKIIGKHTVALVNDMDAFSIALNLQSKLLFSDQDVDTIMAEKTDMERRRRLLVILKTKGSRAFDFFVEGMQETNQNHLAVLLVSDKTIATLGSTPSTNIFLKVQAYIKDMYLRRFKKINPFSLPFTFDIENTWVSLALTENTKDLQEGTVETSMSEFDDEMEFLMQRLHQDFYYSQSIKDLSVLQSDDEIEYDGQIPLQDNSYSQATEDHAELLKSTFEKEKMLIIEGKPASGKTSLMRRLAYEWAKGEQKLSHYDLVLYAEFREVRQKEFETIADLVLKYNETYMESEETEYLASFLLDRKYCEQQTILLLLDGYDESSLDSQCKELSTYLTSTTRGKKLVFNIVITTRPGHLGEKRGNEGRYTFADVLGFTTKEQKEKYIFNHFTSQPENKKQESIAAVHRLLSTNERIYTLAETPLFLTFICLVHERIVDGTVLELYCNTVWWLIDRHQKEFPDKDIPGLFEYPGDSSKKSIKERKKIIQENYIRFPQLVNLGKMAFNNLKKNVFYESDCVEYNLKEVIQQAGLLRKDEFYDKSFHLTTTYSFPHRTIQEFLAALYCFCSHENFDHGFESELITYNMKEYKKFLLRVALSDKIAINEETRTHYLDQIEYIFLNENCDALQTSNGVNITLLKRLLSQCNNIRTLQMLNCIFEASSQLYVVENTSLKKLILLKCNIHRSTALGIVQLKAIDKLEFGICSIDIKAWQSIIEEIKNSSVKCLDISFEGNNFNNEYINQLQKCNNITVKMTINDYTIKSNELLSFSGIHLHSLTFSDCSFEASSQLSFKDCLACDTLEFYACHIDLEAWSSIIEEIKDSSVKYLKLTPDMSKYLEFLQKCHQIEEIHMDYSWFMMMEYDMDEKINFKDYENDIIPELIKLAQTVRSLKRIVVDCARYEGNLIDSHRELIEKAGQERDHAFTVSIIPNEQEGVYEYEEEEEGNGDHDHDQDDNYDAVEL